MRNTTIALICASTLAMAVVFGGLAISSLKQLNATMLLVHYDLVKQEADRAEVRAQAQERVNRLNPPMPR
jgi:hypothetical protein